MRLHVDDLELMPAGDLRDAAERAAKLKRAEALVAEGKGDTVIDLQYGIVPLTAARYASLNGRGGLDDMFSSDLSDADFRLVSLVTASRIPLHTVGRL